MRVLYISNKGETGGAAKSQMGMIHALMKKYDVEPIVLTYANGKLSDLCSREGIENYSLGYEPFMIGGGSTTIRKIVKRILKPYYIFVRTTKNNRVLQNIEKSIDMNSIDLIHTNTNRDEFGAMLSRKYHIPHIWHIREFGEQDYDCIFLRRNAIKFMNETPGIFITISRAVQQAWIKKGISEERTKVVYNGINVEEYDLETVHMQERKQFNIIFTGTIYENKGQFLALQALKEIPQEIRKNIFIDFYGGGAKEYIERLKQWVKKNKLDHQVRFCGFSDQISKILPNYDAALVCSKAEGFGRVTVEHMISGLLVIASNSGANSELIDDNETGFLYTAGDVQSLKEKILDVYVNRKKYVQVGNAARKKVMNLYTTEINAENVYRIYTELL